MICLLCNFDPTNTTKYLFLRPPNFNTVIMTTEEKTLWAKLFAYNIDDESSTFKFSARLARENGWTLNFSKKVIEEYKKFIFLCCITKTGVTPSDQVDQAWHLHLAYTRSYWIDLCKNILDKEVHHTPTKGGKKEGEKFNDFYTDTLNQYRSKFNSEPPETIWPVNEKRFSDINFQRVNLKDYWLFRKPNFKSKKTTFFIIAFISLFFIQYKTSNPISDTASGILVFVILALVIKMTKNNNGGNGSGCSSSGCGGSSGCNSHSGCGGSSGCSGCGGGGCGGGCGGCGG